MGKEASECRWMLGGAEAYSSGVAPWMRPYIRMRPGPQPAATRTLGCLTLMPSPSLDQRFESNGSLVLTSSSVSSRSNRSRGSRCQHCGWHHWELTGYMKISLPIFKDEDKKDAITYQSWHWDIMVYHQARCLDCNCLPMSFVSYRATQRSWWGAQALTSLWRAWSLCWISTTTMSRPWMP